MYINIINIPPIITIKIIYEYQKFFNCIIPAIREIKVVCLTRIMKLILIKPS